MMLSIKNKAERTLVFLDDVGIRTSDPDRPSKLKKKPTVIYKLT